MIRNRCPKIAIVGVGFMGKAFFWQTRITALLDCVAVYDIDPDKFIAFLRQNNIKYVKVSNTKEMNCAIAEGLVAICSDVRLISECKDIDAVVDSSSAISDAIVSCAEIINGGKDLIMLNSEADLTFGRYFAELAEKNNVVYTSCDGDQYGVLKRIVDEVKQLGFQVVTAGNIKGFLNRYANESSIASEADKRNLNHKMCVSFTDGTKLNIEMALIANSEGYITKKVGMFGPTANHVTDVFTSFDLKKLWKDKVPFVDYVLGAEPGGGVYVVGYCEDNFQKEMLHYYKMGKGPFYLFYRHCHLCHLECVKTVLDAVLERKVFMQQKPIMSTNVFAYAKKDLKAGERLDGVGGYTCYGLIENMVDQEGKEGFPICLSNDVRISRNIKRDEKLLLCDIDYDYARSDCSMYYKYNAQDACRR